MYLIYYIPGYYALYTRHPKLKDVERLVLTYFVPIVLFLSWHKYSSFFLVLAFMLVYDLYEIGYIENDCETIKKEKNPTLRVSQQQLLYYNDHKKLIYTIKVIVAIFIIGALYVKGSNLIIAISPFILIPLYLIYNRIRCKWNLLLHAFLMHIRYYCPILIATQVFVWQDFIAFMFLYPIRVIVELSVKGKFGGYQNQLVKRYILHDYSNFQQYRLKYYILTTSVFFLLYYLTVVDVSVLMVYVYFLLFTFVSMKMTS